MLGVVVALAQMEKKATNVKKEEEDDSRMVHKDA